MRKEYKKILKALLSCICIAVIAEVVFFNYECYYSLGDKSESVAITASEDTHTKDGKTFTCPGYAVNENENPPYFEIKNIDKKVKYLYLDMLPEYEGEKNEACFDVYLMDEGNSDYYESGTIRLHPSYEKTKYVRLHSYGKLKAIKLVVNSDKFLGLNTKITVNDVKINANVPMFFSIIRVLILAAILFFIYMFRPKSALYKYEALTENKKLRLLKAAFIGVNVILLAVLLCNNLTYANPSNDTYRQYNLLAEAISQGRVNIDVTHGELMKQVVNPYDVAERLRVLAENHLPTERQPWHDIAFFGGEFYVYFGIVPELLFFLPLYLIAKVDMLTSVAVFISCALTVLASFKLIEALVKTYFPQTSYGVSLFASIILANCCGTLMFILSPIIYYLVIVCALFFIMAGLALWLNARRLIDEEPDSKKILPLIAFGSLFIALSAGCRPQTVLSSFLIIPIFWDVAIKNKKLVIKENISKYLCVIIPYAAVAAGLMYYNYIRFGSPFDFGSAYNLTTNNIAMRGTEPGRLPAGLFMYFLQLPVLSLKFPFLFCVNYPSDYIGIIYAEPIYGGVLFTCCFTAFWFMLRSVRKTLKGKRLTMFVYTLMALALITACLDVELGGIITRYTADFLYLLLIGAIVVLFALYEKNGHKKHLVRTMVALGMISLAFAFFIGFNKTTFAPGSTEGYFNIYSMFI